MDALGKIVVGVVIGVVAAGIVSRLNESPPPDPDARVNRALSGGDTPVPGVESGRLGFGDAEGGRDPVPYAPGNFAPDPTLNAFIDVPNGVGDERRFLSVLTTAPDEDWTENLHPGERLAAVESGHTAWLRVYASNSAAAQGNCAELEGETITRDLSLRATLWDDPDSDRYVARVWLLGSNTTPRWISDAVVIRSDKPLELDSDRARGYTTQLDDAGDPVPAAEDETWLDDAEPIVGDPFSAAVLVGDEGRLGACWQNRWVFALPLVQAE